MSLTCTHATSSSDCPYAQMVSWFWNLEGPNFLSSLQSWITGKLAIFSQEMQCYLFFLSPFVLAGGERGVVVVVVMARSFSDITVSLSGSQEIFSCSSNPSETKGNTLSNLHPPLTKYKEGKPSGIGWALSVIPYSGWVIDS